MEACRRGLGGKDLGFWVLGFKVLRFRVFWREHLHYPTVVGQTKDATL